MCTISLVPLNIEENSFVLTFNRDEAINRGTLAPDFEEINGSRLIMPRDKKAGGTWIGGSTHKRVVCLMNGEFKPHQRKENYRLSRGIIVKNFLSAEKGVSAIEDYNLNGVEAFTLILADWKEGLDFFEVVWDEKKKHFRKLEAKPQIWSSSPLYSEDMKKRREDWFKDIQGDLGAEKLLDFHQNAGVGDKEQDLIIDRGFLKTQSISQIITQTSKINFWYKDLASSEIMEKRLEF